MPHVCIMHLCMFLSQQKYWYGMNLIDNVWHMISVGANIHILNSAQALKHSQSSDIVMHITIL